MAEIVKPNNLSQIWAIAGDKVNPGDAKIQQGWIVEIPPREYENWITNRQDTAIAHFNQVGIAQWDSNTEYIQNKSYVQGSNGSVYRAVVNSKGLDPVTNLGAWRIAFVSTFDPDSLRVFNGYQLISTDFVVGVNSRYYALNSLSMTLPNRATQGDNIILNRAPLTEVTIYTQNSMMFKTSIGFVDTIIADVDDEVNITFDGTYWLVI